MATASSKKLLAPISAVYYPVTVLPHWLQQVAWALPSTHVFEGMRAVMIDGTFAWRHAAAALALDAVYIVIGFAVFLWAFHRARQRGSFLSTGE